jgi:hypothetical protein
MCRYKSEGDPKGRSDCDSLRDDNALVHEMNEKLREEIRKLRKERQEIVPPGMWKVCNDNQTNIAWQPFLDDLFAKRDAEWIRAIAAANGRVKEVPRG